MQSRFFSLALLSLVSAALLSPALRAAAPPYLPLQGVLTDADGTPVDGDVNVEFAIYDSEVGVTPLWSETQRVLVEEGFFTAYLGEATDLDLVLFRDHGDLWLGVTVGTDSEMPRVFLGSTPFTAYAEHCGSVPDHTHAYGDLTGSLPESALPSGTAVGQQGCTGTDKVVGIDLSGALVCATDEDTTYLNGTGLVLSSDTFALDVTYTDALYVNEGQASSVTSAMITDGEVLSPDIANGTIVYDDVNVDSVQRRVTGTCAAGSAVSSIANDGSVGCEIDDDTAAPGTTFEIGGGTAWVANRTTAFAGGWRNFDYLTNGQVGQVSWFHYLPIPDTFAGRDVIVDSIDIRYLCDTGDYIGQTSIGYTDMTTINGLYTDNTDRSGTGSYTLPVNSAFSGSAWIEIQIVTDDIGGYCRVTWFADYHY